MYVYVISYVSILASAYRFIKLVIMADDENVIPIKEEAAADVILYLPLQLVL